MGCESSLTTFGLWNRSNLAEKRVAPGGASPSVFCFLEWLRGLDLNQRPSGYENGVSHLGSLILRDLAPRPGARLLSQICPRQLPGKIRRGLPSLIREHRE